MTKNNTQHLNFEDLFRSLGTAYIVFDALTPDLTVIEENPAHAEMAMVKREDVIGKPLLEAFPDESNEFLTTGKSRLLTSIHKVIKTGKPDMMPDLHYDLKDQNGVLTTKYWEVTHYPVFEGKEVRAVCQQTKDITESVAARRELRITKSQLERALSYGEAGTWMWDLEQKIIVADKNLAKMFGLGDGSKEIELPLGVLIKSVHPDDAKGLQKAINDALNEKTTAFEYEYRVHDYMGDIRWLLARGHIECDETGKAIRFPGIVVDITKRKLAENNLHILAKTNTQFSAELGYRQTLEAIAAILVPSVADWCSIDILENGKIEQVVVAHKNPEKVKWAKQLRVQQGEVDLNAPGGAPWVIRTGKVEHIPEVTDDMLKAVARDEDELQLLRDIDFHSVITAPLKINSKPIGAISFISTESHRKYDKHDVEIAEAIANRAALAVYNAELFQDAKNEIKERKKLQTELEKLNATLESRVKKRTLQLEETNKGLQQEIKRRKKLEDQRVQHYIDLNKTKDEFISLASHQLRTPATGVKQYLGMVLEGMVGEVTDKQQMLLQKAHESNERQLTIVTDLLKVAQIDAGKIQINPVKVNVNALIADVIKEQEDTFAARKQILEFTATASKSVAVIDPDKIRMVFENLIDNASKYSEPGKSIQVVLTEDRQSVIISISDSGVGIAAKDMPKLFAKFNRIYNHLSDHVGGTGLGLYWAKKVVDLHGGDIKVTSVLGKGTTFTIYLSKKEKPTLKTITAEQTHEY